MMGIFKGQADIYGQEHKKEVSTVLVCLLADCGFTDIF